MKKSPSQKYNTPKKIITKVHRLKLPPSSPPTLCRPPGHHHTAVTTGQTSKAHSRQSGKSGGRANDLAPAVVPDAVCCGDDGEVGYCVEVGEADVGNGGEDRELDFEDDVAQSSAGFQQTRTIRLAKAGFHIRNELISPDDLCLVDVWWTNRGRGVAASERKRILARKLLTAHHHDYPVSGKRWFLQWWLEAGKWLLEGDCLGKCPHLLATADQTNPSANPYKTTPPADTLSPINLKKIDSTHFQPLHQTTPYNMSRTNILSSALLCFLLALTILLLTAQPVDASGSWSGCKRCFCACVKNPPAGEVGNYNQCALHCGNSCTAWQIVKLDFVIC
ncbi:hypothetical protein BDK51DRAFT_45613 [Blyttiomyces helicus]|uniref:Uncharacterized protein n=1 Tax=Blyttiomyces helicus TaxID=388810 RepID=A0A4P9WC06_9FUNG|nr:hypothetical protein BDK51DRAFT_45613 [Blyttiomyces helicus]|eukprot:RKO88718.1 hypothetical protein BDK51DRAFT_45613 [Blyttiomyces helicus]